MRRFIIGIGSHDNGDQEVLQSVIISQRTCKAGIVIQCKYKGLRMGGRGVGGDGG